MRLKKVEGKRNPLWKRLPWKTRSRRGESSSDVTKMIQYRPELFGKYFDASRKIALFGPSEWNVGERQLFAAFVSKLNRCAY